MRRLAALAAAAVLAVLTMVTPASAALGVGWCQSQTHVGVLGDSLTSGWQLAGPSVDNPSNPNIWVNRFAAIYGAMVDNRAVAGLSSVNFAPGGDHFASTLAVATEQDGLVFVALGTNDWFLGSDPLAYQARVEAIVATVRAGSPAASIVLLGFPDTTLAHSTGPAATYGWLAYVTALTRAAVDTGAGLILPSQVIQPEGTGASWLYQADDTHLSVAGQNVQFAYVLGRMLQTCE